MISELEFSSLRFGDRVELLVDVKYDRIVGDCLFTNPNTSFGWFYVGGYSARSVCLSILINKAGCLDYWDWSALDFQDSDLAPEMIDTKIYGGWYVGRDAVRSFHAGTKAKLIEKQREEKPLACFECKQFYPYAENNYENKLVCWSCRDSLGWKYGKDSNGAVFLKK